MAEVGEDEEEGQGPGNHARGSEMIREGGPRGKGQEIMPGARNSTRKDDRGEGRKEAP